MAADAEGLGLPEHFAVAHRAGNELPLLERAERAGADVIEADIWLYRGRLEVRHLKTAGPLPILWDRWRLANPWAPRLLLKDLIMAAQPATVLMLDLKGWALPLSRAVIDTARACAPGRPYVVCSQNWRLLEPFHAVPEAFVAHSVGGRRGLARIEAHIAGQERAMLSIHQKFLTPAVVTQLKGRIPVIMSWPINDERTARKLLEWGVNGLITDRLEIVHAVQVMRGSDAS